MKKFPAGLDGFESNAVAQAVHFARLPVTLSDPNLPDNPIVFANDAFCALTGYDRADVIGRNCRFMQGPETSRASVDQIRAAVLEHKVTTIELLNYRKDGSTFVNALQIGPVYDGDGALTHFFGSQIDVSIQREAEAEARRLASAELRHRLNNIVNVLGVVTRVTGREDLSEAEKLKRIDERIRAVGRAHLIALGGEKSHSLDVRGLAEVILDGYAPHGMHSVSLDGPEVMLSNAALTSVSLVLHELATNAVKHGCLGSLQGHVSIGWTARTNTDDRTTLEMIWAESGGPPVVKPDRESGSKMVADMVRSAGGSLIYDWQPTGLVATATLPLD